MPKQILVVWLVCFVIGLLFLYFSLTEDEEKMFSDGVGVRVVIDKEPKDIGEVAREIFPELESEQIRELAEHQGIEIKELSNSDKTVLEFSPGDSKP